MFSELATVLDRLYPTKTWGESDELAGLGAGIGETDAQWLAEELGQELRASTFFRSGEEDEYCHYIYMLCVGREPSLVQIRDGGVPLPEELWSEPANELYLRICLSQIARVAGVQQVAFALEPIEDKRCLVHEIPRAGVYDAPLLHRFQSLVAILPSYGITHLDFGEISAPPPGFHPGEYSALYGSVPDTANYLFYPHPATMKIASLVEG